jgi:hypothetical protein
MKRCGLLPRANLMSTRKIEREVKQVLWVRLPKTGWSDYFRAMPSRATGMNVPQPSRQIRFWFVQAILSNRLLKSYGESRELRGFARVAQPQAVWLSGLSGPSG